MNYITSFSCCKPPTLWMAAHRTELSSIECFVRNPLLYACPTVWYMSDGPEVWEFVVLGYST